MSEGSGESGQGSELQFEKVELTSPTASRACPICQKVISDEYYEVAGNAICSSCAGSLGQGTGGSLVRGFLFGAGAASVSAVVWYLINKLSGSQWGIVAIAVGFFVGIAVRNGARGAGGWRQQVLAMALTYLAISVAKIPYVLDGIRQVQPEPHAVPWVFVIGIALVSPFLAGVAGIMGLVILGIALYEAWKLNRRVPVNGPFRLGSAPATT